MSSVRALALLVTFFSIYSLLLYGIIPNVSFSPYSIHNTSRLGLSQLKDLLEKNGFRVMTIVSSLQALSKINESAIVCIIGPALDFSSYEAISLLTYLSTHGGALLIADDFGSVNTLLDIIWNTLSIALSGQKVQLVGLYFNRSAVLMDSGSYYRTPACPVITRFNDPYGITNGVYRILTNFPSVIVAKFRLENGSEKFVPLPGEIGLLASTPYSWLETSLKDAKEGTAKPDPYEWGGVSFCLGLATAYSNIRLVLISDPDIFTNEVLNIAEKNGFDNKGFIINLFEWLSEACGGNKLVIFDESHLSKAPFEPIFWLGLWLSALIFLSSSWFLAPILPILIVSTLLGFVGPPLRPKIPILKPERKELTSEFAERLRYFVHKRDFATPLSLYISYIIFEIRRRYGIAKEKTEEIIEEFSEISKEFREKYKDFILSLLRRIEEDRTRKRPITEDEFITYMKTLQQIEKSILY